MTNPPEIATLFAPERFREIVVSALVEGRILQTSLRGDAQPDDLAVELLRTIDAGPVRNSVLAGIRDVWLLIQEAVVQPDCDPDAQIREGSEPLSEIVSYFGSLLNRAAPRELEALPYSLLQIVLRAEIDPVLYDPLVRAALAYAYAHDEKHAPFWESQAADELVPEWAFKALIQIDAEHPRLARLLVLRWTKILAGQSKVDPVALTNDVASERKDPAGFRRELRRTVAPAAHAMGRYEWFVAKWNEIFARADERLDFSGDDTTSDASEKRQSVALGRAMR